MHERSRLRVCNVADVGLVKRKRAFAFMDINAVVSVLSSIVIKSSRSRPSNLRLQLLLLLLLLRLCL